MANTDEVDDPGFCRSGDDRGSSDGNAAPEQGRRVVATVIQ